MKSIKTILELAPAAALSIGLTHFGVAFIVNADNDSNITHNGTMNVVISPTCGCCSAWVALAHKEGYDIEVKDIQDVTSVKLDNDVPDTMWACHTALIDSYVVEGHVPFALLAKLLKERPNITGTAVPGMPGGSPEMGNDPTAKFDVIAFSGDAGEGEVFYKVGL